MKEFVKRFFISENGEIDWVKLCETYPEFEKLKKVPQSPKWHAEGNAFIHTQNVYNEMLKIAERERIKVIENPVTFENIWGEVVLIPLAEDEVKRDVRFYLSLLIALFHDIGKGDCIIEDGKCLSHGHEEKSAKIAKRLTWDMPAEYKLYFYETIKWHDFRIRFYELKPKRQYSEIKKILNIQKRNRIKKLHNISFINLLEYIWEADINGSISEIKDDINKIKNDINNIMNDIVIDEVKKIYVLCGLPGSGKNHYYDEFLSSYPSVSRDDIRISLGIKDGMGTEEEEKKVTEVEEMMINTHIELRKTFVINNTNLKMLYRQKIYDIARKNGYKVELIYIERPLKEIKKVRSGDRWEKVINRMIEGMDYPTPNECDIVNYFIQ